MSPPGEPESRPADSRRRGRKYEKGLIVLAVLGLLLLAVIQRRLLNLGPGLSSNQGVVTLVSINLSILVLGVLLFLILKGLYRVFFERQAYGSLQTKMVVSFISLSLIPTILIFYFAYRLVGHGGETWFSQNQVEVTRNSVLAVEEALDVHGRVFPALARGAAWEFARQAAQGGCPGAPGGAPSRPGPGDRPVPAARDSQEDGDGYVTLGTLGGGTPQPPPLASAGPSPPPGEDAVLGRGGAPPARALRALDPRMVRARRQEAQLGGVGRPAFGPAPAPGPERLQARALPGQPHPG
ncbi:MAG: hypothetical protein LBQ79_13605, partial [Deltaproteobacteria bacterium]|nr:hypothetical protein [Deltaproteobacteria bacterium]